MKYIKKKKNKIYIKKMTSQLTGSVNPFKLSVIPSMQDPKRKIQPPIDQSSDYLNSLIQQYQKEIYHLKKYIDRINTEIRKHLNLQVPNLDEGFESLLKNENSSLDQNILNEWLSKLINVDYINPLLSLYDTHIENLKNELKQTKEILKRKDTYISDLVNENKNLRNALEQRNKEFKNFIEVRANAQNSNSEIVMDYEHVMKLEERNAKLSQENDILMTNYNNLQREYTDFRMRINSEFQNNNEKAIAFDEANEQYENLKNNVYNLNEMNKVNQLKIFELSDKNSKLEIENNELKENEERLNQQIMQLETSLNYYKELVEKLN